MKLSKILNGWFFVFLLMGVAGITSPALSEDLPSEEVEAVKEKSDTSESSSKANEEPKAPENAEANAQPEKQEESVATMTSQRKVEQAWAASSKRDEERLNSIVDSVLEVFGKKALEQQSTLTELPSRKLADKYQELNDVATILFVKAEFTMNSGKTEEAIEQFTHIINTYPHAQAWDPRGWFWSVAEKSQTSIDVMTGKFEEQMQKQHKTTVRTKPKLHTKGTSKIIDYTKYGEFENVGTSRYRYKIIDAQGLSKAIGEGIYPNTGDVYNNPRYKVVKSEGRLEGSHWDFVNVDDLEAAYFKWVTAKEQTGVKLFYIGMIFEKAGMTYEALRAYHALVVHFPKTIAWTYWQTPWYPGQAAIAKIRYILRSYPELNLKEKYMKIDVENGYDNTDKNDIITTYPGKIVKKSIVDQAMDKLNIVRKVPLKKVKRTIGNGKVRLIQYENDHWEMRVEGKPYIIQGITYVATKIGQSPDKGTLENWMEEDSNKNGRIDGPYDAWVDKNWNNQQDSDEPVVGDFQLMKEMGVNTIRIYHVPDTPNKELLREMYEKTGIRVIMGDFLGKYAIGSGADWADGTDYENEEHKKNMMASVQKMVMEYKDEPYILFWLLGNENNYGVACNADTKPEAYFKFVDEVAQWIKSVDPNHPVAVNNGDTLFLDIFAENSPNVDIFAANVYRGDYGFGSFWEQVLDASGKPAFIAEYGCPAYAPHLSIEEADAEQEKYHRGNWMDIIDNSAGRAGGVGNSLGGVAFEWMDEWWKNYEPYLHDRKSDAVGPFPGGYYFEEWFGLVGQGNGKHSPFMRQLRKSYFFYKEVWNQ